MASAPAITLEPIAHEHVVDPQPAGFLVKLFPLAAENIALPPMIFNAVVQLVERCQRSFFQGRQACEAFELIVDLRALDPQRLHTDRDFQPAGTGSE